MKLRKSRALGLGIGLGLIMIVAPSSRLAYSLENQQKKVIVAYSSFAPSMLPFLLEKELGFFREEGISTEFVLVRGGGVAVKGLIVGNFDYVISAGPVVDAVIRGLRSLKIVFTAGTISYWLVARPEIRTVTDLKGKIIGISSPGSSSDLTMREIFRRHGLNPFKDAVFLTVGAPRERFASLTSGAVQATFLSPPFNFKAVEMGYIKLANVSDYVKWPSGGLGTRDEKILRDPREVSKMVRASLKGLKFVLSQEGYVLSKLMQMFHLGREEAVQSYETLKEEYIPPGYLSEEAQRELISIIRQAANITDDIPPERVFDNRFVKQVGQELKGWRPQVPR